MTALKPSRVMDGDLTAATPYSLPHAWGRQSCTRCAPARPKKKKSALELQATMFCKNCGKQMPQDAGFCTDCGTGVAPAPPSAPPAKSSNLKGCLVLAGGFVVVLLVIGSFVPDAERPRPQAPTPYQIIDSSRVGDAKCSLDIRLEHRLNEPELQPLALYIQGQHASGCQRVFLSYYLPGMEVGAGGWATTHFNPNLDVKILGLTVEEAGARPPLPDGELVGRWISEMPAPNGFYTIVRRDGQPFGEWVFADGSNTAKQKGLQEELDERRIHTGGIRFETKGGDPHGEYYVLESDGRLGLYGSSGRFALLPQAE